MGPLVSHAVVHTDVPNHKHEAVTVRQRHLSIRTTEEPCWIRPNVHLIQHPISSSGQPERTEGKQPA